MLLATLVAQVTIAGDVLKICGQNLQNYFWSLDRTRTTTNGIPASNYTTESGRNKKTQMIVNALAPVRADIYAFNEVEAKPEILSHLAQRLTEATGITYVAVADGLDYDLSTDPDGMIKSGFIYRSDKVKPYGENVTTAVGYTYVYPYTMRIQTFESTATGERFALSMNHFKAGGTTEDMEKRIVNASRLLQGLGEALDPDILLMGDLNSEMDEECMQMLVEAGYEEQLLKLDPTAPAVYSHCWGDGELIDHVMANGTMAEQVTAAEVLHIANSCSVGKYNAYSDHDPYVVTLDLQSMGTQFVKTTTAKTNGQYMMVGELNGKLIAAVPVPMTKTYDYLLTQDVTDVDGVITTDWNNLAFTFEDAGGGQFYIKDANGRYLYQNTNGTYYYNSVNVSADKSQAHAFTATPQPDGTFKILNTVSNYYFQCTTYAKTNTDEFGLWNNAASNRYMPYLYELRSSSSDILTVMDNGSTDGIRKVMENGHLHLVTPDGNRYNLLGIKIR